VATGGTAGAAAAAAAEAHARWRRIRGHRRRCLLHLGGDAERADIQLVGGLDHHPRSIRQRVALASRVLGQIAGQLGAEARLVGDELLAILRREIDRVGVGDVDGLDGDDLVVIHLLGQLAGQLDGLDVRLEGPADAALEDALQLALDPSQKPHCTSLSCRSRALRQPVLAAASG
jgi:hypothetical protein